MTAEASNNPITKIGRYRITGELGRGGMGIVYRGEDRLIGRRVAIKALTEITPELRERFYLEARSGILSHPNIVTVYELGEHEGRPFIAMEFIEGDSLEKLLRAQKGLSLLEALSIVEQICAGLGYAHGHGVVHRIKSSQGVAWFAWFGGCASAMEIEIWPIHYLGLKALDLPYQC